MMTSDRNRSLEQFSQIWCETHDFSMRSIWWCIIFVFWSFDCVGASFSRWNSSRSRGFRTIFSRNAPDYDGYHVVIGRLIPAYPLLEPWIFSKNERCFTHFFEKKQGSSTWICKDITDPMMTFDRNRSLEHSYQLWCETHDFSTSSIW